MAFKISKIQYGKASPTLEFLLKGFPSSQSACEPFWLATQLSCFSYNRRAHQITTGSLATAWPPPRWSRTARTGKAFSSLYAEYVSVSGKVAMSLASCASSPSRVGFLGSEGLFVTVISKAMSFWSLRTSSGTPF